MTLLSNRPVQQPVQPLWRNRDYLLLWSGQTISTVGGNISLLAFPLLVLTVTSSPLLSSIALALRTIPRTLCMLFAGALVDRWDRKRVMLVCDIGRALSIASIPFALMLGHLTIWQLFVNALLEGTLQSFFELAHSSSLAHVVRQEQLPAAMGQEEVVEGVTTLLGPSLAGVLYSVTLLLPFIVDALSYAASLLTLFLIRTPFQQPRQEERRHLVREIQEGFAWMWRQPVLRTMNFVNSFAALVIPGSTLVLIVLAKQQQVPDALLGSVIACGGIGALISSLLAPFMLRYLSVGRAILITRWAFALIWPLYMLMPHFWLLGVAEFLLGVADPIEDVAYFGYRIAIIPDNLRGRVISACRLFTSVSNPIGLMLTGWSLEHWGVGTTIWLGSVILVLTAITLSASQTIRQARLARDDS
ncbi:MFS transporter [Ktedonospora formicarum]|uniref:MFS transporter n=1 Tax=Ktedonospora formicarum TaxID=2778364 RepID=A0A8J3MTD8_9CHLR|nr:MFS transporter [Ktedonospora formicarum]GHO45508.1 MFS transporter [Ktedonospora formicarum]